MPELGDIYKIRIFFKGTFGTYKSRPVLVLEYDNDNCLIAEITSIPPKNPPGYYDLVKEKIKDWEKYNLDKLSYVKCKNVYYIENSRLYEKIGSMKDTDEFRYIVSKIYEYNS
jgi:mRNA interferase MazF